ncbi:MAG: hypothetical protein CR975_04285 [Gammaproteobacteria bacterium]|nr:MAG: hypothetical protein CR975_04285 [Gammaproteobacteria bacterium]
MINKKLSGIILAALFIAGCANTDLMAKLPDNRPSYKTSRVTNPLEIPPDLTQSSVDDVLAVPELSGADNVDLSTYQNERGAKGNKGNLAASLEKIHRRGDATWVEIKARPDVVFNNAKAFWLHNGLALSRVDKNIGIMETDWLEVASKMPKTGIGRLLSTVVSPLTDSDLRDKFRTRIDYDGKKTYVYLTHYGATKEEVNLQGKVVKKRTGNKKEDAHFAWVASSRNPELEVEMLRRLNLYLNRRGHKNAEDAGSKATSGAIKFSQLADGTPVLAINSDFNQAWALLGIAIDRAGYAIDRQDRRNGIYSFAKITDKKVGLIIKKIDRTIDSYTVGLADQGSQQIAVVRSHNNASVSTDEAKAILQKISQEIRF